MAVNLSKGQRVSLDKSVTMARIGLGWDINQYDGGQDFDLDACVFLLGANGKVLKDEDFVFYNNLTARNGAVQHTGDNRTGAGDGDDEAIIIDFTKIPPEIEKIAVTVTIFDAEQKHQNFGQVKNPRARLYFENANVPDLVYELDEDFDTQICVEFCILYRHDGQWKFKAIGDGNSNNLLEEMRKYGIPAEGNA